MSDTLEQIEELVRKHVEETKKDWAPGKDWVAYSGPVFDGEEYVAAVKQLLSGWLIFGKNARQFEKQFPEHLGMKYGSLTNSGSSANLLAISALKSKRLYNLKEGSKLITPVVCFPTTINPIIQNGFQPVFVDVTLPDLKLREP
jgi:CDP-6-deoxy-D-xylo-4-hexulose-3-dehydrase